MKLLRPSLFFHAISGGFPLLVAGVVIFLLSAGAVFWFMPQTPRSSLPRGTEILRLSPDGRFLLARHGAEVTLWEVATGRASGTLPGDLSKWPAWRFVFSADARWLAAGGDGFLKLWEVPAGNESAAVPISADENFRTRPTFSPDGEWLAFRAEGADGAYQVKVWDLAQGREHASLSGRTSSLRFSPDGKTLAFETIAALPNSKPQDPNPKSDAPAMGMIHLWDVAAGKEKPWFENKPAPLRRLAFSPDGRTLATAERKRRQWQGPYEVKLWDLAGGTSRGPWTLPWGVVGLSFSADGSRLLATTFGDAWELALIDPAASPGEATPAAIPRSLSLSLSADGRLLALSPNQPDAAATIVEVPEFRERTQVKPRRPGDRLLLQTFSPDNQLLAVVSGWADAPPSRRFRLFRSKTAATSAADKTDPSELPDGELHLYETDTGRWQGTVPVVRSARSWFTPDSKTLVVLAPAGTPTIWDVPLRVPWGRIVIWWAVLAGCFIVAGLWLRGRRRTRSALE